MSLFSKVTLRKNKRSTSNLSFESLLTCEGGQLIPILNKECYPGDKWRGGTATYCRLMPMINPIFENIDIFQYHFYIPNRIIWPNWERFITRGTDGTGNIKVPYITLRFLASKSMSYVKSGTLLDYLGYPTFDEATSDGQVPEEPISLLPFLAFWRIYYDYFLDMNLESSLYDKLSRIFGVEGVNPTILNNVRDFHSDVSQILNSSWSLYSVLFSIPHPNYRKDYFTSALPFLQRGQTSQLGNLLNIVQNPTQPYLSNDAAGTSYAKSGGLNIGTNGALVVEGADDPLYLQNDLNVSASGLDINELRSANAYQAWMERSARGGARYKEQLFSHFGVISPDYRLQRSIFLSGGKQPVVTSEVLQTSGSTQTSALGDFAGHGVSAGGTRPFKLNCTEHGRIITMMFIRPKSRYFQGLQRQFSRLNWDDFMWPEFANLSEQAILNKELYLDGTSDDNGIFGYTPRYADLKCSLDEIHGQFRTTLSSWHLARMFGTRPNLNSDFIKVSKSNFGRIFAVTDTTSADTNHFLFDISLDIRCSRLLPKNPIPSLIA